MVGRSPLRTLLRRLLPRLGCALRGPQAGSCARCAQRGAASRRAAVCLSALCAHGRLRCRAWPQRGPSAAPLGTLPSSARLPPETPLKPPQPKMIEAAKKGVKEIPIPGIVRVPTYGTDYLPVRRERNTYIRPTGAAGATGGRMFVGWG